MMTKKEASEKICPWIMNSTKDFKNKKEKCVVNGCMAWNDKLTYECENCGREYVAEFKCNTCACGSIKFLPLRASHGYCSYMSGGLIDANN